MVKKLSKQQLEAIKKRMKEIGCDTATRCSTCGRVQYLEFKNGLKNGWATCCGGLTMTMVKTIANIENEVKQVVREVIERRDTVLRKLDTGKQKPVMLTTPFNVSEAFIRKAEKEERTSKKRCTG